MNFQCTICEEASTRICVSCTKDTCRNHLCEKCSSCSDCCSCEVPLEETPVVRDRFGYDLAAESEPVAL